MACVSCHISGRTLRTTAVSVVCSMSVFVVVSTNWVVTTADSTPVSTAMATILNLSVLTQRGGDGTIIERGVRQSGGDGRSGGAPVLCQPMPRVNRR